MEHNKEQDVADLFQHPDFKIEVNEDIAMLDSLIRSPAFGALKRVLNKYRESCQSVLLNSKDATALFQTQGRMIGLNVIETLPALLVAQRNEKIKREELKKKRPPTSHRP